MIAIQAHGWQQFLAAFGVLRAADVEPVASGGNTMRVADDTCRDVLRAVAATGATVHADLTEPVTAEPAPESGGAETDAEAPVEVEAGDPATNLDAPTPSDEDATGGADDPPVAVAKRPARKASRSRRTRDTAEE